MREIKFRAWNILNLDGTPYRYYYGCGPSEDDIVIGNIYENPELLDNK